MIMTPSNTARIFLALWPTAAERCALADWQVKLKDLGRVMRPETLHATLLFIGEVEVDRLEALKLAVEEISATRFELCFDEARYWQHNHIIYAAPRFVPPALQQLVGMLEHHLIMHRFRFAGPHPNLTPEGEGTIVPSHFGQKSDFDKRQIERGAMHSFREYKPHVTLLRNACWGEEPLPAMPSVRWHIKDFVLVQSLGGGVGYRELARFPLC